MPRNHEAWLTPAAQATAHRRTLTVIIISQIMGGAGLAAGVSVGALLAQSLFRSESWSGLPTVLFTLGSALAAYLVGRATQRSGRRRALALGFLAGGVGAVGVVASATAGNLPMLLLSLFVYGSGTATNLQARYAGADLALPEHRGTGTSMAMVATTVGAVAGPNLAGLTGVFATFWGIPPLAGPFLLAAVAYVLAGLVILALLRPDPFLLARSIAAHREAAEPDGLAWRGDDLAPAGPTTASGRRRLPGRSVVVGAAVMVLTQMAMVALMTMTPVHMMAHGHGMHAVGLVISGHIAAMWLPSLFSGVLVDRWGRRPMAACAAGLLVLAGLVAALVPEDSTVGLAAALILLGMGWNFGLVSGTALVVDGTEPENRPRIQGTTDVLIALCGAAAGGLSAPIMGGAGYPWLAVIGIGLALGVLPMLVWGRRRAVSASDRGPGARASGRG